MRRDALPTMLFRAALASSLQFAFAIGCTACRVTGGNGGLGHKCARAIAIARPQWHVIIAGRDYAKSAEAVRSAASFRWHRFARDANRAWHSLSAILTEIQLSRVV
jgi:hypothetical protein